MEWLKPEEMGTLFSVWGFWSLNDSFFWLRAAWIPDLTIKKSGALPPDDGYISTEGGFGWLWVALANAMTFGESMFFEGHRKHRLYKLAREIYGVLCWLLKNNA